MNTFRATMRWILLAAVIALMPLAGMAQDYEKGEAAYRAGDYATALKEWRPLAEQGHAGAQFNLGLMYNTGRGVPRDYEEAMRWYRKAAELGMADAQYNLGYMYNIGEGVPRDYEEAARWYRMAAIQGDAMAQTNLGGLYHYGKGVPRSFVVARMWYLIASKQGLENAVRALALTEWLKPEQIAEAQRRAKVCMESNYKDCD